MIRTLSIFAIIMAAIGIFSTWLYLEIAKVEESVDKATGTTEEDRFRKNGAL